MPRIVMAASLCAQSGNAGVLRFPWGDLAKCNPAPLTLRWPQPAKAIHRKSRSDPTANVRMFCILASNPSDDRAILSESDCLAVFAKTQLGWSVDIPWCQLKPVLPELSTFTDLITILFGS